MMPGYSDINGFLKSLSNSQQRDEQDIRDLGCISGKSEGHNVIAVVA
jgi:hypothetical protein